MIITALKEHGQKEVVGLLHNDTIVRYAAESGFKWINDDETPWCSIFINWVALKAGYERSKKANARSWLDIGVPVSTPEMGDIVIFTRGTKIMEAHVSIFITKRYGLVYCLGGNQSNMVCIAPYKESDVIAYRKLNRIELL